MKKNVDSFLWVFLSILFLVILVSTAKAGGHKENVNRDLLGITGTPTAIAYLPVIFRPEPSKTPTLMPTATPTKTPTLTSVPLGVQILPNHFSYVDDKIYDLHIVGEVWNNTGNNLRYVKITVKFYNTVGQLIAQDYTYTYLDNLPAWNKTCFHISLPVPFGWSYYQFETPTYWTDGQPLPNLVVLNDSISIGSMLGNANLFTEVRNDQGSYVQYVRPVGTLYNSNGVVLGCDYNYVAGTHLVPGQTSGCFIGYDDRAYFDVTSYRLQVDGDPVP